MGFGLARRDAARGAVAASRGTVDPGRGQSLDQVEFTEQVLEFDDLPASHPSRSNTLVRRDPGAPTRPGRAPARESVAEGALQSPAPRRGLLHPVVQRRTGWRATPSRIEVRTVEREMQRVGPKSYAPTGQPWELTTRRVFTLPENALGVRREAHDVREPATGSSPGGPSSPAPRVPLDHQSAEAALSLLPSAVRASVRARAPDSPALLFEGHAVAVSRGNRVSEHVVSLLRLDPATGTGVVVRAVRAAEGAGWDVVQVTYQGLSEEVTHAEH